MSTIRGTVLYSHIKNMIGHVEFEYFNETVERVTQDIFFKITTVKTVRLIDELIVEDLIPEDTLSKLSQPMYDAITCVIKNEIAICRKPLYHKWWSDLEISKWHQSRHAMVRDSDRQKEIILDPNLVEKDEINYIAFARCREISEAFYECEKEAPRLFVDIEMEFLTLKTQRFQWQKALMKDALPEKEKMLAQSLRHASVLHNSLLFDLQAARRKHPLVPATRRRHVAPRPVDRSWAKEVEEKRAMRRPPLP